MTRNFIFGVAILLFSLVAWSRPVAARFVLPDGQEFSGRFLYMRSDTVYYEVPEGDSTKPMNLYKFDLKKVQINEDNSLVDLSATNFEVTTALKEEKVDTLPRLQEGKMVLVIESNPPDARVYVDDILLEGITPMIVPNLALKDYKVTTRKYLRGVDWWSEGVAKKPEKGDTTKIVLTLEKPKTLLTIQTKPSEAEIYIDEFPTVYKMPNIYSDTTLVDIAPGPDRSISVFKVGYYDTTITINVEAYMPNLIGINLRSVSDDIQRLQMQLDFASERRIKWIGRGVTWASIAPWLGAGVLWALAERDWQEAVKYKQYYADAAFASSETDRFVKENNNYNKSGDLKVGMAIGSAALGLIMSTVGIVLQF